MAQVTLAVVHVLASLTAWFGLYLVRAASVSSPNGYRIESIEFVIFCVTVTSLMSWVVNRRLKASRSLAVASLTTGLVGLFVMLPSIIKTSTGYAYSASYVFLEWSAIGLISEAVTRALVESRWFDGKRP